MNRRVTLGVRFSWLLLAAFALLATPIQARAQLPSGWSSRDIGSVGASGSASGSSGSFTVRGAGADIWGTADGFHFAYRSMTGDGEIVTRVNSVDYLHAWSKAGVMMRESLSAGARHAYMLASAGKGLAFQRRPRADGASSSTTGNGWMGYYVKLTRSGNSFDAYQSADGSSWTWVGSEWIEMPSTIYVGVAVTSHYLGAISAASFSNTTVNEWGGAPAASGSLPSGWSSGDIGAVAAAGWSDVSGSDVQMAGSGADIWGGADEFQFAYRTLAGDGAIVAKVNSIDYVDPWSKGGVMMRDSLTPSSPHAFMLASAGSGVAFQRRAGNGASTKHTAGSGGYFVKLVRTGNNFDAYSSWDGWTWTWVGSEWISMGSTIYVGVAVTSHRDGYLAGASFSGVAIEEAVTAAPQPEVVTPQEPTPPPPSAPPPATGSTLRVLHWNTQHLRGTDGRYDPNRTAYWIAMMQPDIISLNEIDDAWMAGEITNAITAWTGVQWNTAFSGWGNLILTRLPFWGSSVCTFNPAAGRKAAQLTTTFNGRTINMLSAHLATDSTATRLYEVANLQACASWTNEARLIAGDFNMQALSPEHVLATSTYVDGWAAAKAAGATANYSGNCDGCTRNSRIDYIFSSYGAWFLTVQSAEIYDTRDWTGHMASDHKPLVVTYTVQ